MHRLSLKFCTYTGWNHSTLLYVCRYSQDAKVIITIGSERYGDMDLLSLLTSRQKPVCSPKSWRVLFFLSLWGKFILFSINSYTCHNKSQDSVKDRTTEGTIASVATFVSSHMYDWSGNMWVEFFLDIFCITTSLLIWPSATKIVTTNSYKKKLFVGQGVKSIISLKTAPNCLKKIFLSR